MPRTLPWTKKKNTSEARVSKSATPKPSAKRARGAIAADEDGDDDDDIDPPASKRRSFGSTIGQQSNVTAFLNRGMPSSPPASAGAPVEKYAASTHCFASSDDGAVRFMDEGMSHDDKYRMVEDEFLSVAKKFTIFLHTAEYKEQISRAKAREGAIIDSFSRPVAGKMPEATKRKMDSVKSANKQKNAIDGILTGKNVDVDSDSDADLPHFGTALHGLMDSPRKKGKNVSVATRVAAGYISAAVRRMSSPTQVCESPNWKVQVRSELAAVPQDELSTEDEDEEDEEDDLDAPIRHARP
ncbi:hypothetical protein BJ878DRAFT_539367 [Calycina marina]|uniref:Uncharacterized protein n=1 Tax=Calycina marina TaxID=1763456 RepID=A0A9P7Z8R1_9HELO|nr:hypothetical protein BJ878DRAFT_539367 [Calycina marina]